MGAIAIATFATAWFQSDCACKNPAQEAACSFPSARSKTMKKPIQTHHPKVSRLSIAGLKLASAAALLMLTLCLPGQVMAQPQTEEAKPKVSDVRMYVLPDCGFCDRARSHLQTRQIRFEELDIAADAQAKADFEQLGGAGTPLIVIGDRVIHGYDPSRIDAALAERSRAEG
jgi:glutaredoxin